MDEWNQTLGAGPLLGIAAAAIALILLLIIRFRVHAFLTLILVSLLTVLATGVPLGEVVDVLTDSFGSTLGTVALLIALGAMLGKLIEHSGGAKVLAESLVDAVGEKRAVLGLSFASLLIGFPIFFDAGLVLMLPIIFAVARRVDGGTNVLLYGIPAAAAFSVMHVFLPPHPGPVAATDLFDANLGLVLLIGLVIVLPLWWVAGYLWGTWIGRRIVHPVPALFGTVDDDQPAEPPRLATVIGLLALPVVLILGNTGLDALAQVGAVDADAGWVQFLAILGSSGVALLIAVFVAMIVLGRRRGEEGTAMEKLLDSSLGPISSVILITGAGGMFGGVLRASGIGDALAGALEAVGLPVVLAAWLIAVLLRLAQGSATVALVTSAGLVAPAVLEGGFNPVQIACIVLATAAGSVFASHVNDSGFWLVGRLMGLDVKTTLKTWTVQQTIQSVAGFLAVLPIFLIAGAFA
ncbi:GntP family permease [Pseudonocardia nematodicida]|uniref:GntP family permease n=1 Tax=Pseudonocardia nematodicida TaxID=1206997 RepID=A0ABV1KE04_9PSEU